MLQTENLSFSYPNQRKIQFPDLKSSPEPLLILGPSGCGKTTLLHLIAGLLKPASGQIKWDEKNISHLSNNQLDKLRGKEMGLVFQRPHFVQSLCVLENITLQADINKSVVNTPELNELLDRLEISHLLSKKTHQLSEGEKQRVNIARAIANKPTYLLADEPTSALDDANAQAVLHLLINEAKLFGVHVLVITHDHRLKDQIINQIELTKN